MSTIWTLGPCSLNITFLILFVAGLEIFEKMLVTELFASFISEIRFLQFKERESKLGKRKVNQKMLFFFIFEYCEWNPTDGLISKLFSRYST